MDGYRRHIRFTGTLSEFQATYVRDLELALLSKVYEDEMMRRYQEDAGGMLEFMLSLVENSSLWDQLLSHALAEHRQAIDRLKWKRVCRLLVKLACTSGQLPPSVKIEQVTREGDSFSGGGAADIYKGSYGGRKVAIKRLRCFSTLQPDAKQKLVELLYEEALIWRQLKHAHVMEIYGINSTLFAASETSHCIVMPWMDDGNINQFLEILRRTGQPLYIDHRLLQIAKGLEYLHERNVVHGDLRGANVLIDSQHNVRLTDFGVSVFMRTRTSSVALAIPKGGTYRWMSPEHFASMDEDAVEPEDALATAMDIYSFACTCIELYSGMEPQFDFDRNANRMNKRGYQRRVERDVSNGKRPERPSDKNGNKVMGDALWSALQGYWAQKPVDRPTAKTLVQDFTSFVNVG